VGALGLAICGGIFGYGNDGSIPGAIFLAVFGLVAGGFVGLFAGIVAGGAVGFVLEVLRWLPRVIFHPRYHISAWLAFIGGAIAAHLWYSHLLGHGG
jgi:hypothetical protein